MATRIEGFGTTNPSKNLGILCPRSRKIDWFSIICRLKTFRNAFAAFGDPLILGVKCTESTENLAESYFFRKVSPPRTEVKKWFRMDSWYELSSRPSCRAQAVAPIRRERWFDLGQRQQVYWTLVVCHVRSSGLLSFFATLYSQKILWLLPCISWHGRFLLDVWSRAALR